jgi:pyruvate kinase
VIAIVDSAIRRTKIVATIGPRSATHGIVRSFAEAGMDAVRLNFSHGTHEEHAARAAITRAVQAELGRPLALIADLQGPRLRVGALAEPRELVAGETVVIARGDRAQAGDLIVAPAVIGDVLAPGHDVLIDDGLIRLLVETSEGAAPAAASSSAARSPQQGVNLPGVYVLRR